MTKWILIKFVPFCLLQADLAFRGLHISDRCDMVCLLEWRSWPQLWAHLLTIFRLYLGFFTFRSRFVDLWDKAKFFKGQLQFEIVYSALSYFNF